MKSSGNGRDQILGLISRKRAERLLLDWANLFGVTAYGANVRSTVERDAAIQRISSRYPELFEGLNLRHQEIRVKILALVLSVREGLKRAWDAPDGRHRDWYIFKLRDLYQHSFVVHQVELMSELLSPAPSSCGEFIEQKHRWPAIETRYNSDAVPAINVFEAALFHFQGISDRTRHCANSNCPAPYFFATKKGQRYCSDVCALPAQREAKRRWWAENRAKR